VNGLNFFFVFRAWPLLAKGLVVTLELTFWSTTLGLFAGFLLALASSSRVLPIRSLARAYIDFFRCTPALVQIVWFFFCIPMLFNVFWSPLFMGILILGMNFTAFSAEAFRAAFQSIPTAHEDAAIALGLGPVTRTLYVTLPQAIRYAAPVLITLIIGLFQQSSLVALVGVPDLMYQGKLLSTQTYRPIETFSSVALLYLIVSVSFGRFAVYLERRSERFLRG
jgi:polar amino acid transport system permease protein